MRSASGLVLVGALALGGGAVYLTRGYIESRLLQPAEPAAAETRTIVVASQPLTFGAALTGDNLVEIPWPASTNLEGAFGKKDDLLKDGKRVVLSAIQKNEPVLASKVTEPNQKATLSVLIDEKMRAVTVRVDDVRGVAGFVSPNDRVDVVLTRVEQRGENEKQSAEVLLQNVKVLAVDQITGERQDKAVVAKAVTLEVDVQQSQKVILAQQVGKLALILRNAGLATSESTRKITTADLGVPDVVPVVEKPEPVQPPTVVKDTRAIINVVRWTDKGFKTEQMPVVTERAVRFDAAPRVAETTVRGRSPSSLGRN
jgi:pilus assembly protein CpaB